MEWGIKLKVNSDNDVKIMLKKAYTEFIVQAFIYFIIVMAIGIFISFIGSKFDYQWLYDWNPSIYHFIEILFDKIFYTGYYLFVIIILMLIVFLVLLYRLLKKIFSYITAISDSSDKLFDKNIEYITLPEELSNFEKKLNHFKRESIKNEKLALENKKKKDELIVYLAHDIKTPLTSMIGYLSLLNEIDDMPKQKRKKYISVALDKSYKLEELINELFDTARYNSEKIFLEKEELNLNLMLEQIIDDFYPILKERNKNIIFNYKENITLYADSDKLSRVFNNLIKNAINYSKEKSDININVFQNDKKITIKIVNEGKKIPKEKLNRIFEQFYRLDSSRTSKNGGSGLGLAIAKDIIELHKGTIKANSNEKETTFTIELPL